jgi:hypothetical protein
VSQVFHAGLVFDPDSNPEKVISDCPGWHRGWSQAKDSGVRRSAHHLSKTSSYKLGSQALLRLTLDPVRAPIERNERVGRRMTPRRRRPDIGERLDDDVPISIQAA